MFILSNIKDAYSGSWKEIQESKPAFEQVMNREYPSKKEWYQIGSVTCKVVGTLGLCYTAFIAVRTLLGTSSFAKLFFGTMSFIGGHDLLRTGDNLHKRFVTKKTGLIAEVKKLLKVAKGAFSRKSEEEVIAHLSADNYFGGTIVVKLIADIAISSHYKQQQ